MLTHPVRMVRPVVLAALFAAPLVLASSVTLAGETEKPSATAATAPTRPMTAEQHLAKAEEYSKKAASFRADAEVHHKMLAEYRGIAVSEGDSGLDRKAMQAHCEGYYKKADALATEAEKFADYHRKRAAELQGK
jgi:hypothetical protein